MPITITLPQGTGAVGPGVIVHLSSDFIGPLPPNASWSLQISTSNEGANTLAGAQIAAAAHQISWPIQLANNGFTEVTPNATTDEGSAVFVLAELSDPLGVVDTASPKASTWTNSQLGWQAYTQATTASSGFTTSDRQLLTDAERRSRTVGEPDQLVIGKPSGPLPITLATLFSRNTLDSLSLDQLTPSETFEPVRVSFSGWYFGVIVRVTTIGVDLVAKTPDAQWYFPDLAVLRIFRGADLQFRRGIHTPTFMTEHPWEYGDPVLNETIIFGVPPDMTIAVDWREGCGGFVFLQRMP